MSLLLQTGSCEPWEADLYDRWPMVVKLSNRVEVEWFRRVLPISETKATEMAVSGIGTIAAGPSAAESWSSFCRDFHVCTMDQSTCFH